MKKIRRNFKLIGMLALVVVLSLLPRQESQAAMANTSLTVLDKDGNEVPDNNKWYEYDSVTQRLCIKENGLTIKGNTNNRAKVVVVCDKPVSDLTLWDVYIGYESESFLADVDKDFLLNIKGTCIFTGICYFDSATGNNGTITLKGQGEGASIQTKLSDRIDFISTGSTSELNLVVSGDLVIESGINCKSIIKWSNNKDIEICDNAKVIMSNDPYNAITSYGVVTISDDAELTGSLANNEFSGSVITTSDKVDICGNAQINIKATYSCINSQSIIVRDNASLCAEVMGRAGNAAIRTQDEIIFDTKGTVSLENNNKGNDKDTDGSSSYGGFALSTSGKVTVNDGVIRLRGYYTALNSKAERFELGALQLVGEEASIKFGKNIAAYGSEYINTPYNDVNDKFDYKFGKDWNNTGSCFVNDDRPARTVVFVSAYEVSFVTNGASAIPGIKVKLGEKATLPKNPVREKYTFGGWFTDAAFTQKFDASKPITKDTILYAKWISNQKDNTITAKDIFKDYSTKKQTVKLGAKVNGKAKLTYTSNNKKVKVDASGKVTIPAKFVGTVKLTIKSAETDKYRAATKTVTLTVTSSKTKLTKATALKKSAKLTWKKISNADGYEITYANNKDFKNAKKVTVKKTLTSTTIKKLTSKKTYYFKIRTYKKSGGKKIYSDYSAVKKVKIK